MYNIIYWNMQGFKAKYEEFREPIESKPALICLQESMLGKSVPSSRGYTVKVFSPTDIPVSGARLLTFVRHDIPFQEIPLVTEMHAKAYRVN